MKRLRYYILGMKPASESYEEMYEGKMYETFLDKDPFVHNHAVYWDGEIGYEITKSNRLELSKPTVTIHIPMKLLQVEDTGTAALDYIFRAFIPYIRALNEQNDNRKRPAKENGHYEIYEPNHKVLVRNVVSAKVVPQKYYRIVSGNTIQPIDGRREVSSAPQGKSLMIVPTDYVKAVPAYLCASIMIQVQLPEGKHKKGAQMLSRDLPEAVNRFVEEFDREGFRRALALYAKQQEIRTWLRENGYCAFVGNGSILPREKGGDGPMQNAVPFCSTAEDEVTAAGVRGMAFRRGVTVITGGGYSGKSTLLDALSAGVYNHIEGDGREYVLTDDSAMKISAEDGRCVRHVNLSPFIKWIPGGNPADFSTEHASGSTSQAANIMEAVGWGARLLMIDEDKSATNFMIQDSVMKALIEKEPITPFVERVGELARRKSVSTILVIGGSSEYLQAADRVYMMRDYRICQVTEEAKALQARCALRGPGEVRFWENEEIPSRGAASAYAEAAGSGETRASGEMPDFGAAPGETLEAADFSLWDQVDAGCLNTRPEGSATEVLKVSDLGFLILGREQVDIRMIHDIATIPQLNAIAFLLRRLMEQVNPLERFQSYALPGHALIEQEGRGREPKWICREEEVERLLGEIERDGLESVYSPFFTECGRWMDLPRKYEILAVLSRMRLESV